MMPQVVAPEPPPPPPEPARPVLHEYHWSQAEGDSAAAFSLVLNGGEVRRAIAVWMQGEFVSYIAPDGNSGRIRVNALNREVTRQLNAEKHLKLLLPSGI